MARKPGRPPLLDDALSARVLQLAGAGVPRKYVADAVGVSRRAFAYWLAKGRDGGKGDAAYVQLLHALKKAEAEAVAVSVGRIRRAGSGGALIDRKSVTTVGPDGKPVTTVTEKFTQPLWVADAWLLERRYPDEFSTDRRELRELRKLVNQLVVERGGADAARQGAHERSPTASVERDPNRLELVEEIVTRRDEAS